MGIKNIVTSLSLLVLANTFNGQIFAQELDGRQCIGVFSTFAPNSSHILIGDAEHRRVWTVGLEYSRRLWGNGSVRLDYEGSVSPFFQERDPTVVSETQVASVSSTTTLSANGQRVIYANNNPIGYAAGSGDEVIPIYPIYGSTKTYAFAISPVGARVSGFSSHWLQPTFSTNLGMVFSSRDLPIDDSASMNYLFSLGPGVEIVRENGAIRLEYLFRHMSNANSGHNNPGVDSGVFRLTLSRSRR